MERCLELAGATYIDARTVSLQPPASELESDDRQILEIAIQPALITYYRTDTPNLKIRRISPTRGRLRAEGKRACETVKTILSQGEFVATYIPNGRFPSQKMAELAQREPSKEARNTFTASWTDQLPPALVAQMPEKKIAGVFTSSQDEFHFLGPEWHLHSWESKLEAFDTVLSHFEADGYLCNLRIQPIWPQNHTTASAESVSKVQSSQGAIRTLSLFPMMSPSTRMRFWRAQMPSLCVS